MAEKAKETRKMEKQRDMKLYTFFFQYKDLTHVHQHKSQNIEMALKAWGKES
jgi:hypothetical protein